MNCRSVQQSLSAYIDQELSGREMLLIRSHVLECEQCSAEEEEIRRLKGLLTNAPMVEPPDGFEQRLKESLDGGRPLNRGRSYGLPFLGVMALASGVLTLLLLHAAGPRPEPQASNPPTPPAVKADVNFGVRADQASVMSHDPLSGGSVVFATSYERR